MPASVNFALLMRVKALVLISEPYRLLLKVNLSASLGGLCFFSIRLEFLELASVKCIEGAVADLLIFRDVKV